MAAALGKGWAAARVRVIEWDEQWATEIGLSRGQRRRQLHRRRPECARTGCARGRGIHAISVSDNGTRCRSVSQLVRAVAYAQLRWRRDVVAAAKSRHAPTAGKSTSDSRIFATCARRYSQR